MVFLPPDFFEEEESRGIFDVGFCLCCKSDPCRCDEIYETHRDREAEREKFTD